MHEHLTAFPTWLGQQANICIKYEISWNQNPQQAYEQAHWTAYKYKHLAIPMKWTQHWNIKLESSTHL